METAIMIDGAFIRKKYRATLKQNITAPYLQKIILEILRLSNLPSTL